MTLRNGQAVKVRGSVHFDDIASPSLLGWRPSLVDWRPSLLETKNKEKEERSNSRSNIVCHSVGGHRDRK